MSKAIILTEDQYSRLLNVIDNNSHIFEDYAADLQKRMKAGAKQATINATKCPTNYKALTPQEIKNYSSYQIKPWLDTRTMNKNWKVLSNGTVCKIIQTTWGGGSDYSIDEFAEALRSGMGSLVGIIAQVILDFVPAIGPIINVSAWSFLAAYDIEKGITTGKPNWFNIIVDLIGVATTGPGAAIAKKALAPVAKYAGSSMKVFFQQLKRINPNGFKYIYGLLKNASSWVTKVTGPISKMISALSTKAKNTSLYSGLVKLKNGIVRIHKIIHEVEGNLLLIGAQAAEKVGEKYIEAQVVHTGVSKLTGHGHGESHGGQHKAISQAVQKGLAQANKKLKPKTTIPRYITVNGIKKPNPKFKQTYGYA
jgi:hypothetical protein